MSRSSSRLNGETRAGLAEAANIPSKEAANIGSSRKKRKVTAKEKATDATNGTPDTASSKMPQVWKGVKGKRGFLKKLVDMPCDILLEIFGHLSVSDLHTLATSAKGLRAMLLNRSLSLALWKNAFERLSPSPPPCPEEISPPQYASFLYSRYCFHCDARATTPWRSWLALSVFCKNCQYAQYMDPREESAVAPAKSITPLEIIRRPGKERAGWRYFRPTYRKHDEALKGLADRTEDKLKYVEEEKAKLESRRKHQASFRVWERAQEQAKADDQQARRLAREKALVEKIKELGYGDVLQRLKQDRSYYIGDDERLPLLKGFASVRPLTENAWEKIKPKVVEALEKEKQQYMISDRRSLIGKRTDQLKEAYNIYLERNPDIAPYAPPVRRLAELEPFRTVIYDTPEDQDNDILEAVNKFDTYGPVIDAWKAHADGVLHKLMGTKYVGGALVEHEPADVYRLRAAFRCTECMMTAIMYPEALKHYCLYTGYHYPESRADPNAHWDFNEGSAKLEYDPRVYPKARYITDAYELDLETVTCKELDEADAGGGHVLECTRCDYNWRHNGWRKALSHELNRHTPGDYEHLTDVKWRRHPVSKLPELEAKDRISISEYADYYSL